MSTKKNKRVDLQNVIEGGRKDQTALIAVDVQNDFLPGGALAVKSGNEVIEPLITLAESASFVVGSQDWHPADHSSFKEQGGTWPVHCVQYAVTNMDEALAEFEQGAAITPRVAKRLDLVVQKGGDSKTEAYSAFDADNVDLAEVLKERGITDVVIGGLAGDYCVKATALAAAGAGFNTIVVADAVRSVNIDHGDEAKAFSEMEEAGVRIVR